MKKRMIYWDYLDEIADSFIGLQRKNNMPTHDVCVTFYVPEYNIESFKKSFDKGILTEQEDIIYRNIVFRIKTKQE